MPDSDGSTVREPRDALARYAFAGVEVAWLVNVPAGVVAVYPNPTGAEADPRYTQSQTYAGPAEIPVVIFGQEVGRLRCRDLIP
ncbi:MAG: hypothetical protein IRY99_11185 [Isosphaeraceae bacterium]|nr:hypothetical protein [Isosphaeraceae bacterium]